LKPHKSETTENRFLLSLSLTGFIFLAELVGGFWTGSLALLADSAHVFLDVFALGISYLAIRFAQKPADTRHTFGFHRAEVLAALVNGITLVIIALGIFYESYKRFFTSGEIKSGYMLIIAVIGLVINLVVALILRRENNSNHSHGPQDINVHSAYLHVIGDAVSSIGVIIAAILIFFTGWNWLDPIVSILIGFIILSGAYRVTRRSLHILLEGTPEHLNSDQIEKAMNLIPGVEEIHDLHIWNICSGHVALSSHIVTKVKSIEEREKILTKLQDLLANEYMIEHATLQLELNECYQVDCN
jgi:cobalt-zinc-cadmium efflux system protein